MGSPVEAVGGQIVIGDLLLTWISESGSGKIIDLRARAGWLMRTEDLGPSDSATNQWLRDAASLGHCEVDWKRGTWSVAPPIVTRLNLSDGLAILVGARRPRLIRALDEAGVYFESARRPGSPRDFPVPSTILIPYEQICDLEQAAIAIGARFSGCAASGIAAMLEQPALTTPAAPPAYDSQFEQLAGGSRQTWRPTSPRDSGFPSGLYREKVHGRWQYLLRRDAKWYESDHSTGIFAELARHNESVIQWRPDGDDYTRTGTLIVDRDAPLPPLHARALVLCSGFTPRIGSSAETVLYDNVPYSIATRVARSLEQCMQVGV